MGAALSQATYPPFIFSLAIGIPSLILYLLEVVILLTKPTHFRSAFFRLFIMRFISNTINYFCSYFFMRLGRLGILFDFFNAMPSSILAFCYFFNFYTFHADNISTMFILLNRLTLIISPMGHETIWKYLLPASILVIYLTPLSCTVQLFTYDFFVRRQDDNKTFTLAINFKPEKKYIASAYLAAVSAVIFSVLCGMLNLVIVILYRRSRNPQTMARMVEQQVESRLTIYAIVTFIAQLSMALYWIVAYVSSSLSTNDVNLFLILANQHCWIYDMTNIVLPAWFLLYASTKVRDCVRLILLPRSWHTPDAIFTERRTMQSFKLSKVGTSSQQ